MNFFDRQDRARKRTRWLILVFILAVALIVLAIDALVVMVVANAGDTDQLVVPDPAWLKAEAGLLLWSSLIVLAVILGATVFKISALSGGGGVVARSLGGTLVPGDVTETKRRQLRNVVEEISIASGVPVPEIYVLESESGINAFAAGYSTSDAAVAVSRGCLERLNRAELQGVIAHEYSHVLNGDMRLNIRLMGILFGILMIGLAGRQILRGARYGGKKDGLPLVVIGLSLAAIGFIGLFFGRLIQAAVSRQREYLADASAVQFTREPEGIAGALKKIAALSNHGLFEAADPEEVGHMLFADGVKRMLFATHPPLEDRIRAIQPNFNPAELRAIAARMDLEPAPLEAEAAPASAAAGAVGLAAGATVAAAAPERVTAVGNPSWDHVAYAERLIDDLPDELLERSRSLQHAVDVVLALLIDGEPGLRERQLAIVADGMGAAHRERVEECLAWVDELNPLHRLPLVEIAFPAVKRRPRQALTVYLQVIGRLIRADGDVTVFEFALSKVVTQYLADSLRPAADAAKERDLSLRSARGEIEVLLAVLADLGHADEGAARRAYVAGLSALYPLDGADYRVPDNWVAAADRALERLDGLKPMFKQALLEALIATMSHDGRITLEEVELLRAICAALHCPMPPELTAA